MNRNALGVAFAAALAYLVIRDGGVFTAPIAGRSTSTTTTNPTIIPVAKSGVTITLLNSDLSDALPPTPTTIHVDAHMPSIHEIHYSFCKS
jgi:hypothetical protein